MSDHADTITEATRLGLYAGRPDEQKLVNSKALARVLAERQQAIDAQMRSQTRLLTVERRCEQAIDALREIAIYDSIEGKLARAALVSLGEKP